MAYVVHASCQIPGLAEIYEKAFGPDFVGSFVEVGAFDGITYSNTWGLAENGWFGVYIEAHPDFSRRCGEVHAKNNVINLNYACGAHTGYLDLVVYGEVSTGVLSRWNRDWGMNDDTPKIKVKMIRLEELIKKPFDLLVIDVEEMEIEVLKGFTLENYLPKMVIIELHEGQGTRPDQKGWQTPWVDNYFSIHQKHGYEKIYSDQINTIYVLRTK